MTAYIVMAVAICLSAFFASAEIAYTSLNRVRLERLAEEGRKNAKIALRIRNNYDSTLCSILICNDFVNIMTSSIATTVALMLAARKTITAGQASTLATVIVTVAVLIFGDIVPKILAKQNAMSYALAIAYPLRFVTLLLYPVSRPVALLVDRIKTRVASEEAPTVTEDELSAMFETAEEEGVVDEEQGDLLQSAMEYQETTVEDILNPRINVVGIDADAEPDEIREICLSTNHSRLPVYEETLDHIIGVLSISHYLKAATEQPGKAPDVRTLVNDAYYVHKTAKLPNVLSEMRRRQIHMAVVIDEYGGTMGLVTMEDILEEIVGDIWDETDNIEIDEIKKAGENRYEVDGMTPIADFFEELELDDRGFESEYTTMGGWAVEMLQEEPHVGDCFTWRNLHMTVTEMKDNLVSHLLVTLDNAEEEEE